MQNKNEGRTVVYDLVLVVVYEVIAQGVLAGVPLGTEFGGAIGPLLGGSRGRHDPRLLGSLYLLEYEVGRVVVGQEGQPYGREEPRDVCGRAVVGDLALLTQQQELVEGVEHPRAGLVHRHDDALALLLGVHLQPGYQTLGRVAVEAARRLVQEHQRGVSEKLAGYARALLLATRQPALRVVANYWK